MRKCISSGSLHSVLTDSRDHRKRGAQPKSWQNKSGSREILLMPFARAHICRRLHTTYASTLEAVEMGMFIMG
jgi:hypothetical protein